MPLRTGVKSVSRTVLSCAVIVGFLAVPVTGNPLASASQRVDVGEESATITLSDRQLMTPVVSASYKASQRALWFAPSLGRIFTPTTLTGDQSRFEKLLAYDQDTFQQVDTLPLSSTNSIWGGGQDQLASTGQPHTMVVDEDGERLFAFAASIRNLVTAGDSWAREYAAGKACIWANASTTLSKYPCTTGVHVIDARSLDLLKTMPIGQLRADAITLSPVPRAISYEPANEAGAKGKLLVLVEEHLAEMNTTLPQLRPRGLSFNLTYLLQFDPETGGRDWALRLESCHAPREKASSDDTWSRRPHPAAVFRSEDPSNPGIWVGCHSGTTNVGTAVWVPLDGQGAPTGVVEAPGLSGVFVVPERPAADQSAMPGAESADFHGVRGPEVYIGSELVAEILADPQGSRMAMRTLLRSGQEVWTIFDGEEREFVGRVGIGEFPNVEDAVAGIDPNTGRLYVSHGGPTGGLFVADIRRTPLPQAIRFAHFADVHPTTDSFKHYALSILPAKGDDPTRIFVPDHTTDGVRFRILEDRLPISRNAEAGENVRRSLDLSEVQDVTASNFDAAARGFGARMILQTGVESAARVGVVDPVGLARGSHAGIKAIVDAQNATKGLLPGPEQCTPENRDVVAGFVGPTGPVIVDGNGSRGSAVPLAIDGRTYDDLDAPATRCTFLEWDDVWGKALFGRPPVDEPRIASQADQTPVECTSTDGESADSTGDTGFEPSGARINCRDEDMRGYAYFQALTVADLSVAQSLSSFRIYRDPGRGIVSRVESVARGIEIPGVLKIDTVRGTAESWASGRRQPVADEDQDAGYRANCDLERSAGTCFQSHLFGVWTPGWSCGPCGDEQAFSTGVTAALGVNGRVRLRKPDPSLARGSEDGYLAAVQKSDAERFADLTLNNDQLQTTVPVLEIVRYTSPYRWTDTLSYEDRAGRQIYQFAGVEVSSSYSIQCLLVYDEESNTCAAEQEPPGSLTIELTDVDGSPLAGGAFEIRLDSDHDGIVGLADELVPDGACVTTEDGIGSCNFTALAPGDYVVTQVVAPPGYAPASEPYAVELVSGEARTVTFANASNAATVAVSATDEHGEPLEGATFAVYADPDADGAIAPDAQPAATCQTGPDGTCAMTVPLGTYVLAQMAAHNGLDIIQPLSFALTAGGQTAAVAVVNYPLDASTVAAAIPVTYQPPDIALLPRLHAVPLPTAGIPQVDEPQNARRFDPGGTVVQIVRTPGDVLRLLTRDPQAAAAFAATLLLFVLAAGAMRRRRMLEQLTR